jgi:ATP-binding cassette subfamily B protein
MKGDRTAPKGPDVTLQERFTALQNLPRFFKLVWQTSPLLTLLNILLRLVRSPCR